MGPVLSVSNKTPWIASYQTKQLEQGPKWPRLRFSQGSAEDVSMWSCMEEVSFTPECQLHMQQLVEGSSRVLAWDLMRVFGDYIIAAVGVARSGQHIRVSRPLWDVWHQQTPMKLCQSTMKSLETCSLLSGVSKGGVGRVVRRRWPTDKSVVSGPTPG